MTTTVQLASDKLRATVLTRGAALAAVRFAQGGRNLLLGFADPEDHTRLPVYAGHLVGPVANRVARGEVEIGGRTFRMPRNENGETCLHSGPAGIHARDWDILEQGTQHVMLGLYLADGEQGLPGNREIRATYTLDGATLTLAIDAETDRTTPMNIAPHPYWNLDGGADVSGHRLWVRAARYLPVDARSLPTGEIDPVADTAFDFRDLAPVPLSPALDVNFCLDGTPRAGAAPSARLVGRTGVTLDITTTAPALQVYNGASLPNLPGVLDDGGDLGPFRAIALEPQFWPDAPNHAHFPDILLRPGMRWSQVTHFRLSPAR